MTSLPRRPPDVRSCLILGSGRSGTSMLAGVLAGTGYYMGDNLWPAREANPKGFFEDGEINHVNERLIAGVTPQRPGPPIGWLYRHRPVEWQRWLAHVPVGTRITPNERQQQRMATQTARGPFCFKDPRFCVTLPAWRPFIGDAAFLCVFRSPATTVASILKDRRDAPYLSNLSLSPSRALAVWVNAYRHVLEQHRRIGDWLFLHYDQVFDASAAHRLQALLGVEGDWGFPDGSLRRSTAVAKTSEEAEEIYRELCRLAGYRPGGRAGAPADPDATAPGFRKEAVPISSGNLFDLGVVDVNQDGNLGVFTLNHNSRQSVLVNRGGGRLKEAVEEVGLVHDPVFPGWDDDSSPVAPSGRGLHLYRRGRKTIVVESVGITAETLVTLEFVSPVKIEHRSGVATAEVTTVAGDGEGPPRTVVRVGTGGDARMEIRPELIGAPLVVRVDEGVDLAKVFVGPDLTSPATREFTLHLRDRHGMAWADHDGDGRLEVFVVRGGLKGRLERMPGVVDDELFAYDGRRFRDVLEGSGIHKGACRGRQTAWVDVDGGGLCLFVTCLGAPPHLYRPLGEGKFLDISGELGLDEIRGGAFAWVDVDGDDRVELLAVAGSQLRVFGRDGDGRLQERQVVDLSNRGAWVGHLAVGDWDGDGDADIFAPSWRGNTLLRNDDGVFTVVPPASVGLPGRGTMTATWVDFDSDGFSDLHLAPGGLYRQGADGRFAETGLLDDVGPANVLDARAVWFDMDNDGRPDVVMALAEGPVVTGDDDRWSAGVYRNATPSGHWLQVELAGPPGNRHGIGARVMVTAGSRTVTQWMTGSHGSFFSQGHYRLYFGLGEHAEASEVEVRWPGGASDRLGRSAGDELVTIEHEMR